MASKTLTINHADGGSETYTINRDKFAGVREMTVDGQSVSVDHTAVPKEQSRETTFGGSQSITIKRDIEPLLDKVVGGATAAYSLRSLISGDPKVVNVRRESDNAEQAFTASEVASGALVDFVNADGTQYMTLDGVDDDIDVNAALLPETGDFTLTITFFIAGNPSSDEAIFGQGTSGVAGRLNIQIRTTGSAFTFIEGFGALTTGNAIVPQSINTIVLSRSGTTLSLKLNTGTAVTLTEPASSPIQHVNSKIGHAYAGANFEGVITDLSVGSTTWDGTAADATSQGWTVNGTPSTNALNDGFVETWYDQSGNGNDATQDIAGSQPLIVENGNLLGELNFDGLNHKLDIDGYAPLSLVYSSFLVASFDEPTASSMKTIFDSSDLTNGGFSIAHGNTQNKFTPFWFDGDDTSTNVFGSGSNLTSSESLYSTIIKTGVSGVHIDGALDQFLANTWTSAGSNSLPKSTIGYDQSTPTREFEGAIAELIIYETDQSSNRLAIEKNINNYYEIY